MEDAFDYIVIGAGSAGCAVANRLSENPAHHVLLLEAGPEDKDMWIHVPAGMPRVLGNDKLTWTYFTEPEPNLGGKRVFWPRGKTLGGTSAINGMAFVRGQPDDYNHWAQLGNKGWSWDDVLPFFKKSESYWGGTDELHSNEGAVQVTSTAHRQPEGSSIHRATQAFIDGGLEAGLPLNTDFNGPVQEGIGWIDHNIDKKGRRHTTASAYLKPIRTRTNLTVHTDAMVDKIHIRNGQAEAVSYRHRGDPRKALVRGEIIVSGGVINSPQTLMLSGIGPSEKLKRIGIEPIVDSPDVGENLQDHMYVYWVHEVEKGYSFNGETSGAKLLPHIARYYLTGSGLLTTGSSSAYIFCKSLPGSDTPDTQIGFRAFSSEMMVSDEMGEHAFPGWSASVCYLRPKSRGHVALKSADPDDPLAIYANYLSHPDDLQCLVTALRLVEKIYDTPKIKKLLKKRLAPAEDITTDEALEKFIRRAGNTMYHPVGTCRMGTDEKAVVDPRLRVNGVRGLRVADASIMPHIISGNTNSPAIMIGEKAAHMILEDAR